MMVYRALAKTISQLLIGVLLFTQIAMAAYACPAFSQAPDPVQAAAMAAMPDCEHMADLDSKAPSLCFEHCHPDQQSSQTQLPAAPAILLTSLYSVSPTPLPRLPALPSPAWIGRLASASPPHAILHCCFRV